jgi:hypothetical protein
VPQTINDIRLRGVQVPTELWVDRVAYGDIVRANNFQPRTFSFCDEHGNKLEFVFQGGKMDANVVGDFTLAARTAAMHILSQMNDVIRQKEMEVRREYESGEQD